MKTILFVFCFIGMCFALSPTVVQDQVVNGQTIRPAGEIAPLQHPIATGDTLDVMGIIRHHNGMKDTTLWVQYPKSIPSDSGKSTYWRNTGFNNADNTDTTNSHR